MFYQHYISFPGAVKREVSPLPRVSDLPSPLGSQRKNHAKGNLVPEIATKTSPQRQREVYQGPAHPSHRNGHPRPEAMETGDQVDGSNRLLSVSIILQVTANSFTITSLELIMAKLLAVTCKMMLTERNLLDADRRFIGVQLTRLRVRPHDEGTGCLTDFLRQFDNSHYDDISATDFQKDRYMKRGGNSREWRPVDLRNRNTQRKCPVGLITQSYGKTATTFPSPWIDKVRRLGCLCLSRLPPF